MRFITCISLFWVWYSFVRSQNYTWPMYNVSFDCIVGIATASGSPLSQGTLVTVKTIITSANPLNSYIDNKSSIKVLAVNQKFNVTRSLSIAKIEGNQVNRKSVWVQTGDDDRNSPIHDIVLIILTEAVVFSYGRGPKFGKLIFSDENLDSNLPITGWITAGFGYTDIKHITKNLNLEITNLEGSTVDCDEWFPRDWGHFICISNDENLPAVPSGGPLFHTETERVVLGIGCFSMRKGNESILVFTNFRPYRFGLRGFVHKPTTTEKNIKMILPIDEKRKTRISYFMNNSA
ncbi:unnamed protein product [Leptosia nina]|uniref:Uncharacterized protein n=1 Tax=Leptosia nina TaxID=320188 RepID=A0AAV1IVW5_9NEOP